ncbi:hypothetical protein Lepto782_22155 (plasmid) [Leptospira interrogans serovar Canicola]|uniref:Lipoprotein n=1 Tax=Leptospira interrogans serovar Canicola TaxID=211880 RepID=A0AAP9WF56_LEPIR|nr:hypothetical protein LEP1GSC019_0060 [Leptospira interrogans serovar Pyrogenes str. 2006006960]QOI44922.1 hypothetical protein Lepto782_22155 [Leptospira interrogans serovar Canicola]
MIRRKNITLPKVFLIIGLLLIFGCLPYSYKSQLTSEKTLSTVLDREEPIFKVNYHLTGKSVIVTLSESRQLINKVKVEKTFTSRRHAEVDEPACPSLSTNYRYWDCMLVAPIITFGLGYIITIPIMLYDWITYPIYTAFSTENIEIVEETKPSGSKEVIPQNYKLILTNEKSNFNKTYTLKEGKIEIPFDALNLSYLWNSGDQEVGRQYQYYYSVVDGKGKEVLPISPINGTLFHSDTNFAKLADLAYEKGKQIEFNRCSKKFELETIREGYKYIMDNGWNLREDDWIVGEILKRACHQYKGTNSHDACLSDFRSCIRTVRYIDNQNTNYQK